MISNQSGHFARLLHAEAKQRIAKWRGLLVKKPVGVFLTLTLARFVCSFTNEAQA